jgi:hypothetical protein
MGWDMPVHPRVMRKFIPIFLSSIDAHFHTIGHHQQIGCIEWWKDGTLK